MNKASLGSVERLGEQDPDSAKERPVDEELARETINRLLNTMN